MGRNFKSFKDLANDMEVRITTFEGISRRALKEVGIHVVEKIKAKHGDEKAVTKVQRLPSAFNKSSPLLDTGHLRDAVSYIAKKDSLKIFSIDAESAIRHEFGTTFPLTPIIRRAIAARMAAEGIPKHMGRPRASWGSGMVVIPPRPIWRSTLNEEKNNVLSMVKNYVDTECKTYFK